MHGPVVELVDTAVFKTEAFPGSAGSIPAGATIFKERQMARTKQMKDVEEALAEKKLHLNRLQSEMEVVKAVIETLESILRRASGQPDTITPRPRARTANVKGLLIDLLREVGPLGLNAASAVEMAQKREKRIERGTASSLLSRLKADGVVAYDGTVYRLMEFMPGRPTSAPAPQGPVLAYHASKGVFG